jgi:hypothetical protein
MRPNVLHLSPVLGVALAGLLAASPTRAAPQQEVAVAKPAASIAATAPTLAIALSDLDAYQRGLQAEINVLKGVRARLESAQEARDEVAIAAAMQPVVTRQYEKNAAEAAGVDLKRYRALKKALGDRLVTAEYLDQLDQQAEQIPTTGISAKQRADQRKSLDDMRARIGDPYAGLEPAVRDALKQRADALSRLRIDSRDLAQDLKGG